MDRSKQTRPNLTNEEIPFFELLKSTITALDDVNVAAFAGTIPIRKEEKDDLRLFTVENDHLFLRSFPLSEEDAKEIHDAGEVNEEGEGGYGGHGNVLKANKFGFTGPPEIPSYILNRVGGQYSSPIEYRLNGLFALGPGDSIILPNDKSTEFDEDNSYIDSSTNVKYYMPIDHSERAGTVLVGLPTRYEGGGNGNI